MEVWTNIHPETGFVMTWAITGNHLALTTQFAGSDHATTTTRDLADGEVVNLYRSLIFLAATRVA